MPKLVGFTGCHGTGKTTVLKELEQLGYSTRAQSLSRAAQAKLNLSVGAGNLDIHQAVTLQCAIADALITRDTNILHEREQYKGGVVFADRSPIDVIGYNRLWVHENKEKLDALDESERSTILSVMDSLNMKLRQHVCTSYAGIVFFPIREEIPFVAESGRLTEETRYLTHDLMWAQLIDVALMLQGVDPRWITLQSTLVADRIGEVEVFVNSL